MTRYIIKLNNKYFIGDSEETYSLKDIQIAKFASLSGLGNMGFRARPNTAIDKYLFSDKEEDALRVTENCLSQYVMGIIFRQKEGFMGKGDITISHWEE